MRRAAASVSMGTYPKTKIGFAGSVLKTKIGIVGSGFDFALFFTGLYNVRAGMSKGVRGWGSTDDMNPKRVYCSYTI